MTLPPLCPICGAQADHAACAKQAAVDAARKVRDWFLARNDGPLTKSVMRRLNVQLDDAALLRIIGATESAAGTAAGIEGGAYPPDEQEQSQVGVHTPKAEENWAGDVLTQSVQHDSAGIVPADTVPRATLVGGPPSPHACPDCERTHLWRECPEYMGEEVSGQREKQLSAEQPAQAAEPPRPDPFLGHIHRYAADLQSLHCLACEQQGQQAERARAVGIIRALSWGQLAQCWCMDPPISPAIAVHGSACTAARAYIAEAESPRNARGR